MPSKHRAPHDCPVCGADMVVSRVGCPTCGAELAGDFSPCDFCALDDQDLQILRVFLASRGNMREVEKHLGVSYPTARARFTALLLKLGLAGEADDAPNEEQILADVAAGKIAPEQAARLLATM